MYYVYIMASRSLTLYIGITSNLRQRAWQHRNHAIPGFTADYNIERLVYYERFAFVDAAIAREKQLKRWSRVKKLGLIQAMNPTWIDLAEEWLGRNAGPSTRFARSG